MNDVFIILPGASLNRLTDAEKEYIKTRPVISSGHYLLYWETIGIFPDVYIHVGHAWDSPTNSIVPGGLFYGTCVTCKHHGQNIKFYVQQETKLYIDGGPIPRSSKFPNQGLSLKPCPKDHGIETIAIDITEHASHQGLDIWADTITDKFWFNSGVGSAINLATVLYPGHDIKLLGNDGGTGSYFYNHKECDKTLITAMGSELTRWASSKFGGVSSSPHYNMKHFNTNYAIKMVEQRGGKLYNCNSESFFTQGAESHVDKNFINKHNLEKNKNLFSIPFTSIL